LLKLYKPLGLTPLQALDRLRQKWPKYATAKLSYAGRLDPLAEGVMLVVVGEETKNKDKYLKLDKVYEFETLFGFATDTHDLMGKIVAIGKAETKGQPPYDLLVGPRRQEYPKYSSPKIAGKKSFSKLVNIYKAKVLGTYQVTGRELGLIIKSRIGLVDGDFRQKAILARWQKALKGKNAVRFGVSRIRLAVSSGTYIRLIADGLGKKLHCPSLAFSIKRTKVGRYKIEDCLKID